MLFVICALALGFYGLLIENENWHVLIYSGILYVIVYTVFLKSIFQLKEYFFHIAIYSILYVILQFILTSSPYLQVVDFRITHPTWQSIDVQILSEETDFYKQGRSAGFIYVGVDYQFLLNHQYYRSHEKYALKQYYVSWSETPDFLRALTEQKWQQAVLNHEVLTFVNPSKPTQAKLFYSDDLFDFRGSWFARASLPLFVFLIYAVFASIVYLFQKMNYNKKRATSSEPLSQRHPVRYTQSAIQTSKKHKKNRARKTVHGVETSVLISQNQNAKQNNTVVYFVIAVGMLLLLMIFGPYLMR